MNTPITDANVKCIPILDPDGEGTLRMKSIVEPDVCREMEQQAERLAGALMRYRMPCIKDDAASRAEFGELAVSRELEAREALAAYNASRKGEKKP